MKVLVINASVNKERSTTLRLTNAFLEGMGESAEIVNTIDLNVNPCRACFSCWFKNGGVCAQKDDAIEVLQKLQDADLVIWSIPLYAYGIPSHCKALVDRTLSFNQPEMYLDEKGVSHHYGCEEGTKKTVLISTAGLANNKGNFDGLIFSMKHMYGEGVATICCAEGSLFMNKQNQELVKPYLEKVKLAGAEYKAHGHITAETQKYLDTLIVPSEEYIQVMNSIFGKIKGASK